MTHSNFQLYRVETRVLRELTGWQPLTLHHIAAAGVAQASPAALVLLSKLYPTILGVEIVGVNPEPQGDPSCR